MVVCARIEEWSVRLRFPSKTCVFCVVLGSLRWSEMPQDYVTWTQWRIKGDNQKQFHFWPRLDMMRMHTVRVLLVKIRQEEVCNDRVK